MNPHDRHIGVLYGGPSEEREVSLRTGSAMAGALQRKGYQCVLIDAQRDLPTRLNQAGIDMAMIALHGPMGEDGTVQGLLEIMGIPYTGSGVTASAVCMDKGLAKRLFRDAELPTPAWREIHLLAGASDQDIAQALVGFPLPGFVKPCSSGSSVGIARVADGITAAPALRAAALVSPNLLVEAEVNGVEVTLAILSGIPLPLIGIQPMDGFYDYTNKYTSGRTSYRIPPDLTADQQQQAITTGIAAYHLTGCSGLARVDLIVDQSGVAWILEINTVPGMTETSLAPKAAQAAGITFDDLVERILLDGLQRSGGTR